MNQTKTLQQLIFAPKEAYRLFVKVTDLADALEEMMENHAAYSPEFLSGLKLSLKQAKQGKLKKINSLRELK